MIRKSGNRFFEKIMLKQLHEPVATLWKNELGRRARQRLFARSLAARSHEKGGLDFRTVGSSLILASILIVLVIATKDANVKQQAP
jgi:uncharacterized membrane-anchored protein